MRRHKVLIFGIGIIIILMLLGGRILLNNPHEQKFHASYFMNDQKTYQMLNNKYHLAKNLKVNPKMKLLYSSTYKHPILQSNNNIITYRQLPTKKGLIIKHITKLSSNKYKIYWMEMNNLTIRTINSNSNQRSVSINPMGNKYSTFNLNNLNHQGFFVISTKQAPKIENGIHKLYMSDSRIFSRE